MLLGVEIGARGQCANAPGPSPGVLSRRRTSARAERGEQPGPWEPVGCQCGFLDPRGGEPSCREDELALAVDVVVPALTPVGPGAVSKLGIVAGRGADGDDAVEAPSRANTGSEGGTADPKRPNRLPTRPGSSFFVGRDLLRRIATAGACGLCSRKPCSGRRPHDPGPGAGLDLGQPRPGPLGPAGRGHFCRGPRPSAGQGGRRALPAGQGHRRGDAAVAASASRWGDFG